MEKIRVLIVDDHPLFRQGVRHTLEATKDIEVIGEAPDGQRAIQMAETLAPDIMLVDINLPGLNGLEVTRVVRRRQPQIACIILTVYECDEQKLNATKQGAGAYSANDIPTIYLIRLVCQMSEGNYPNNDIVVARPVRAT